MRPAMLGAIGWLLVVPGLYLTAFDLLSLRNLREAWRGEAALTGELDETLACDLVTDFVKETEFTRKVSCDGHLVALSDAARLTGVRVEKLTRTYCLARTPKWTVLRDSRAMPCFPTPPPELSRPLESERERVNATAQTQLNEWLDGVRAAMQSTHRPSKCPQISRPRDGVEVPLLEYELLQSSGDPDWSFLTTTWLRDALTSGDAASTLEASRRWSEERPWVAVVTSSSRTTPRVGPGEGRPWVRGQLTGTLSLVDAGTGEVICERDFTFRSSDSLQSDAPAYGKRRSLIKLAPIMGTESAERIRNDFRRRYDSAASRTVSEMTSYGVRTSRN